MQYLICTQSHITLTQSMNTTLFCASTQAMVPKHQVWTAMQLAGRVTIRHHFLAFN